MEHALKMFRDDRLEYKNCTLQVKMPDIPVARVNKNNSKPKSSRRTTKYDFSGTNYETCTLGHVSCLETLLEMDPDLIENICKQARELAGVRKLSRDHDNMDKYTALQTDPEFLARASLFKNLKGKKNKGGAAHKDNEESRAGGSNNEDIGNGLEGNVQLQITSNSQLMFINGAKILMTTCRKTKIMKISTTHPSWPSSPRKTCQWSPTLNTVSRSFKLAVVPVSA